MVPYFGVFFLAESKGLSFWCLAGSERAGTGRVWNIFDFGILRNKIFTYICTAFSQGTIAQLVEQRTENPCVPSSNLGGTTKKAAIKSRFFFVVPVATLLIYPSF